MSKIFVGKWPQVVTELKKVYEPGKEYVLSENEFTILSQRGFIDLFVQKTCSVCEKPEEKPKGKAKAKVEE